MVEDSWVMIQSIKDKIRGTSPSAINQQQGPMLPNDIPLNLDQAAKFDQSTPGEPQDSRFYNSDISSSQEPSWMVSQVDTSGSLRNYHKDETKNTDTFVNDYRARTVDGSHGNDGPDVGSFMGMENNVIGQDEHGNNIISKSHANTKVFEKTSYHTNEDNLKIWTTKDTKAEGNYPATTGGVSTRINLDVNPNLNKMENIMALQKKNLLGIDKKTQGLNTITGEKLDIASIQPAGTHKFEMWDYGAGTSRDVFYNIGKNTDRQQHQDALNKQSFGQFQNQLQKQFNTNLRSGNMDGRTLTNIIDKINAAPLTDKQKAKLRKEYKKKAKNYQVAIGGYGSEDPYSWTSVPKERNLLESLNFKLNSGGTLTPKESAQRDILSGAIPPGAKNYDAIGDWKKFL